jgi:integrase
MLESGKFSVNEIARFMGHSNTQMIFNRYVKYIESEKREIKNFVDIYGAVDEI